jgi:protease-4
MQFSLLKEIFGQPWHIEASTFQRYFPLATAVLRGNLFTPESEPLENLPFKLRLAITDGVMAWDEDDDEEYEEDDSISKLQPAIFVLKVRGLMMKNDMMCGPAGTRTLGSRLKEADKDNSVIGHIIIFETGGGSADSVPELAEAIEACSKPVVAWVDGIMCSAGMYTGSYCKEIIASRGTDLVGSIGTMMIWEGRKANSPENFEGTIHQRIYADEATEKNIEYEAAINDNNFKLVKERILNPHNLQFVTDIKKNRPGASDEHLHGRAFNASEVIGALVDSIGDFSTAIDRVVALSAYQPGQNAAAQSGGNTASSNNKIQHMKFNHLQAVLGPDPLEFEADGRRTFTDEEMQAVEDALAAQPDEVLQSALDAERQTVASLREQVTQLESGQAETQRQLDGANELNEQLTQEVSSLKKGPAAPPAIAVTETETSVVEEVKEKAISEKYENPMDAIHEISETYLNRKL